MKKTILISVQIILILLLIVSYGCSKSTVNDIPFKATKVILDGFYVRNSGLNYKDKEPYCISYIYKANVSNNSNNIFEKVVTRFDLSFELENGNIITKQDFGTGMFGEDILEFTINYNWKPNENQKIERLISANVPVKYIDYPVKRVFLEYKFECEDQINNTKPIFIEQVDVTKNWNDVVAKVKSGQIDCGDFMEFARTKD